MQHHALLCLALLVGCRATSAHNPVDGDPGGGDLGGGDDGGQTILRDPDCSAGWLTRVSGQVTDESAAPIANAAVQLCLVQSPSGAASCLQPAFTDDAGAFNIALAASVRCLSRAALRARVPHALLATSYGEMSLTEEGDVALSAPLRLYATTAATTLPAEGDGATLRTVTFADGLEVDIVPDDYFGGSDGYPALAARVAAPADVSSWILAGSPTFEKVYAFSPEGEIDGEGFAMRVPNTTGLAAGTTVTFYVQGGLDCRLSDATHIDEATWATFGEGTVSGDGSHIDAPLLPCFNWFGYAL